MNVFTASGHVGKDCEVKFTQAGMAVGQFSLAVSQGFGEKQKTSWLICKIFGKKAEAIGQYITKGSKVSVTGEFVEEKFTGQDGQPRSMNVIMCRDVDLPPNPQGQQQAPVKHQSSNGQAMQQWPQQNMQQAAQARQQMYQQRPAPQPQVMQMPDADQWIDDSTIPF